MVAVGLHHWAEFLERSDTNYLLSPSPADRARAKKAPQPNQELRRFCPMYQAL
jgi:hypothetical protein